MEESILGPLREELEKWNDQLGATEWARVLAGYPDAGPDPFVGPVLPGDDGGDTTEEPPGDVAGKPADPPPEDLYPDPNPLVSSIYAAADALEPQLRAMRVPRGMMQSDTVRHNFSAVMGELFARAVPGSDQPARSYLLMLAGGGTDVGLAEANLGQMGYSIVARQGISRVPGGDNQAYPSILHGGERVLTAQQTRAMDAGGSSGGGGGLQIHNTFVIQGNGDTELVRLIREKALPTIIEGVERNLQQKARFGQMQMDNRIIRTNQTT